MLRLRTKYYDKNLMIGSAFHNALGEWYKGKRADMAQIVPRYTADLDNKAKEMSGYYDQEDFDKLQTAIETFAGMMMGYAEVYEEDRANWKIIRPSIEAKFSIDMGEFDYAGKIDLVTEEKKGDMLVEHKTASSIGDSYIDRLPLDTQIRGYIFAARHPKGLNLPVSKVLYDVIKKCKLRRKSSEDQDSFNRRIADDYMGRPDFYFYREPLLFNKQDLAAFEYEIRQTHEEYKDLIKRYTINPEIVFGSETPKQAEDQWRAYFDPRGWTPNDGCCNDYFRQCEYLRLCTTGLDKGTGSVYIQNEHMHEELADED